MAEEMKLIIKNYYELAISTSAIIADADIVAIFLTSGNSKLISDIYRNIYVTPKTYEYLLKTLTIEELKELKNFVQKAEPGDISKSAIRSITEQSEILTEDEAYAIMRAMIDKMDFIIDDPRKAHEAEIKAIHVVRPSDIVASAATTKRK